jgi:hypothetical protein
VLRRARSRSGNHVRVPRARQRSLLGILVVVLGCLASCSGSSSTATGTVTGTIREVGGPAGFAAQIPGTVRLRATSGSVYTATTTASRAFSIALPVGSYRVSATSPTINDGKSSCLGEQPAIVTRGGVATVRVVCSIK